MFVLHLTLEPEHTSPHIGRSDQLLADVLDIVQDDQACDMVIVSKSTRVYLSVRDYFKFASREEDGPPCETRVSHESWTSDVTKMMGISDHEHAWVGLKGQRNLSNVFLDLGKLVCGYVLL